MWCTGQLHCMPLKKEAGPRRGPPYGLGGLSPLGAAGCRRLLDPLLALGAILRRELALRATELEVVTLGDVLQVTLLVGEVASLVELLLPKAGVVVVALDGEVVLSLYIAALVLRIPKIERDEAAITAAILLFILLLVVTAPLLLVVRIL